MPTLQVWREPTTDRDARYVCKMDEHGVPFSARQQLPELVIYLQQQSVVGQHVDTDLSCSMTVPKLVLDITSKASAKSKVCTRVHL